MKQKIRWRLKQLRACICMHLCTIAMYICINAYQWSFDVRARVHSSLSFFVEALNWSKLTCSNKYLDRKSDWEEERQNKKEQTPELKKVVKSSCKVTYSEWNNMQWPNWRMHQEKKKNDNNKKWTKKIVRDTSSHKKEIYMEWKKCNIRPGMALHMKNCSHNSGEFRYITKISKEFVLFLLLLFVIVFIFSHLLSKYN